MLLRWKTVFKNERSKFLSFVISYFANKQSAFLNLKPEENENNFMIANWGDSKKPVFILPTDDQSSNIFVFEIGKGLSCNNLKLISLCEIQSKQKTKGIFKKILRTKLRMLSNPSRTLNKSPKMYSYPHLSPLKLLRPTSAGITLYLNLFLFQRITLNFSLPLNYRYLQSTNIS